MCGLSVRLLLHVRRFRCLNPTCPAVTFSERLPELLVPAAAATKVLLLGICLFTGIPGGRRFYLGY